MSQRTALITTLARRLATVDVPPECVAHVQARISQLRALTDQGYLEQRRALRDAAE